MGIGSLQEYIESTCKNACAPVDLLYIGRSYGARSGLRTSTGMGNAHDGRFYLVIDAESCLDRLYGGYYSDWVCGGQWNRMLTFVNNLTHQCFRNNIELCVFFNGCLESHRRNDWYREQIEVRKNVNSVLKHVNNKGTPPPKVWWTAPSCLRMALRMAFREMGVPITCSMDDHPQEVIAFCRENNYHGLMAQDSEYFVFDPPRFFSSRQMKLTFKGTLETKEYFIDNVAQGLDLNPNRFCIMAALLGNHILHEDDLKEFFADITGEDDANFTFKTEKLIPGVVGFVRSLVTVEDLDAIACIVFRHNTTDMSLKTIRLKQSVQYYLNGTIEGFLKYRPKILRGGNNQSGGYTSMTSSSMTSQSRTASSMTSQPSQTAVSTQTQTSPLPETQSLNQSMMSSSTMTEEPTEKEELVIEADNIYIQTDTGYGGPKVSTDTGYGGPKVSSADSAAPQIVVEPPIQSQAQSQAQSQTALMDPPNSQDITNNMDEDLEKKMASMKLEEGSGDNHSTQCVKLDSEVNHIKLMASLSSSSSSSGSPHRLSPDPTWTDAAKGLQVSIKQNPRKDDKEKHEPLVSHEIMRVASERHQKGLMSPWVYQVLSHNEIKFDVSMEEESNRDLPSSIILYRKLRQRVYTVLFNLGQKKKGSKDRRSHDIMGGYPQDVVVKEWRIIKSQSAPVCEEVRAASIDWAVPSIHRLWLGQQVEDKNRRLRAFLSCLEADSPLMLTTTYVSQHHLIMCCVLRYMLQHERPILRRHELDAFLAQAVCPMLHDSQATTDLQLNVVTTRGVQLASLFMSGVEAAIFANDSCGSPIQWSYTVVWQFFDGKLFHEKLLMANNNLPLIDICNGQMQQVMMVERLRTAIVQGLPYNFAQSPLPLNHNPYGAFNPYGANTYHPSGITGNGPPGPGPGLMPLNRGQPSLPPLRGHGMPPHGTHHPQKETCGGRLEIAGVVVGSWGGNPSNHRSGGNQPPPLMDMLMYNTGRGMSVSGGRPVRGCSVSRGMPAGSQQRSMMSRDNHRPMPRRGKSGMAISLEQAENLTSGMGLGPGPGPGYVPGMGRGLSVASPIGENGAGPLSASDYLKKEINSANTSISQSSSDVIIEEGQGDEDEEVINKVNEQFQDAPDSASETLRQVIDSTMTDNEGQGHTQVNPEVEGEHNGQEDALSQDNGTKEAKAAS